MSITTLESHWDWKLRHIRNVKEAVLMLAETEDTGTGTTTVHCIGCRQPLAMHFGRNGKRYFLTHPYSTSCPFAGVRYPHRVNRIAALWGANELR